MDATALRAMQAPLKERYKGDPKSAYITLKAKGTLDDSHIACKVETGRALAVAGLHPATGGTGPYTFTRISGTLPPNLAVAPGGTISGTATAAGTYTFTIKATDATGCSGTKTYTITVTN